MKISAVAQLAQLDDVFQVVALQDVPDHLFEYCQPHLRRILKMDVLNSLSTDLVPDSISRKDEMTALVS